MGSSILEDLHLAFNRIRERGEKYGVIPVDDEAVFILSGTPPEHMPQIGATVYINGIFDTNDEYMLKHYATSGISNWLMCLLENKKTGKQLIIGYPFVKAVK